MHSSLLLRPSHPISPSDQKTYFISFCGHRRSFEQGDHITHLMWIWYGRGQLKVRHLGPGKCGLWAEFQLRVKWSLNTSGKTKTPRSLTSVLSSLKGFLVPDAWVQFFFFLIVKNFKYTQTQGNCEAPHPHCPAATTILM